MGGILVMRKRLLMFGVAWAVALASIVPAGAAVATDPMDGVEGDMFDFKVVQSNVTGPIVEMRARMWNRWSLREFDDCLEPLCSLAFFLDAAGDQRVDHVLGFETDGDELWAELYELRPRQLIEILPAGKRPRSAVVHFAKRLLDSDKRVRWYAFSFRDRAPDDGWIWLR
jgi:hypothetical protein